MSCRTQFYSSGGGKSFDAMHRLIMIMKATIRGIYGSVRDLQGDNFELWST